MNIKDLSARALGMALSSLWGSAVSRVAAAVSVVMDSVKQSVPAAENQTAPEQTNLSSRDICALAAPTAQPVPWLWGLQDMLSREGFEQTRELGIAMDLGFTAVCQQAWRSDPRHLVRQLWEAAGPQSLEQLAERLEKYFPQDKSVIDQVRVLAERYGNKKLACEKDSETANDLVHILAGLADHSAALLGQTFGLPGAAIDAIRARCQKPSGPEAVQTLFRTLRREIRTGQRQAPTCREWMDGLAQAGVNARVLENLARQWNLAPPQDFTSWTDYQKSLHDPEKISADLLAAYHANPEAVVHLKKLMVVTNHYANYAGKPAVHNPDDLCLATLERRRQMLFVSLLEQVDASGGKSLEVPVRKWRDVAELFASGS